MLCGSGYFGKIDHGHSFWHDPWIVVHFSHPGCGFPYGLRYGSGDFSAYDFYGSGNPVFRQILNPCFVPYDGSVALLVCLRNFYGFWNQIFVFPRPFLGKRQEVWRCLNHRPEGGPWMEQILPLERS